MSHYINKESKRAGIHQSFSHQKFLMRNSPKFSSAKHLCYKNLNTVIIIKWITQPLIVHVTLAMPKQIHSEL